MEGYGFEPIGYFNGTLDGNNKTISKLTVNTEYSGNYGLFKELGQNAKIFNLKISEFKFIVKDVSKEYHFAGFLVGYNSGTIDNVQVSNSRLQFTLDNDESYSDEHHLYAGAIAGKSTGPISGCTVAGCTVIATRDAGAVVGNCYGAISGCTVAGLTIDNTTTSTTVKGYCAGGVAGSAGSGNISGCTVSGTVIASSSIFGGIVGYVNGDVEISDSGYTHDSNSIFDVNVYVGGIVGYAEGITVKNCTVDGITLGKSGKHGFLVGYGDNIKLTGDYTKYGNTISNCYYWRDYGNWSSCMTNPYVGTVSGHIDLPIRTAENLKHMTYRDATYRLMNDISLVGNWYPNEFYGKFYGNGHTISGLSYSGSVSGHPADGVVRYGLFSATRGDAEITDLTISNASIYISNGNGKQIRLGMVVGNSYDNTKIINCKVEGGHIYCGKTGHQNECGFDRGSELVGGIVGLAEGNTKIYGCTVSTNLEAGGGAAYCGGIAGVAMEKSQISGCTVAGHYHATARCNGNSANNGLGYAGSVAGAVTNGTTISGNNGNPYLETNAYLGGNNDLKQGNPYAKSVKDYAELTSKWKII